MGLWEDLKPASFEPDGGTQVQFPIVSIEKEGGNRLAPRERPFRDGAKLDNLGRKQRKWTIEAVFSNELSEPGISVSPAMWPDRINELEKQLESRKTGTLHLPWERNIRARADSWRRSAKLDMRDTETMSITFVEDNEDALDGQALTQASVRSTASTKVEEAIFDAESIGAFVDSLESLTELAGQVEAALAAPGQYLDDVASKIQRAENAIDRVVDAFSTTLEGRDQGNDPDGALFVRKMGELKDSLASVGGTVQSRRVVGRTWQVSRDIFSIAAEIGQDVGELLALNTALEDPSYIPARTTVMVYA